MASNTLVPNLSAAVRDVSRRNGYATFKGLPKRQLPRLREVGCPLVGKKPQITDVKNAFAGVKSGDSIYLHGIAATPTLLTEGLCDHAKANNLTNLTMHHLHLEGLTPWTAPDLKDRIRSNSLFTAHNLRGAVNEGIADFNSIFLSDTAKLFRRGVVKVNVALIQVSSPDANGFCSLGVSVDCTRAAVTAADHIIAVANKYMPRTHGDGLIHESHIDVMVEHDAELFVRHPGNLGAAETKIGELVANHLVDNGATLQMGIGAVPDAVLGALKEHKNLGVHTEMLSDGILPLIDCNAVDNSLKVHQPGRILTSFAYGSTNLYKYLHDNPYVYFGDVEWVNDPSVIRQNPKVTAINSAVEVDITGQVVSDSIGKRFISGFGGQVDFIRGAALSNDGLGKAIITLPSIAKKGQSKIVPYLQEGSGVVTSRAHVNYVVTEYGIAELWGRNVRQRAHALIKIAHPDNREALEKAAFDRLKIMPSAD